MNGIISGPVSSHSFGVTSRRTRRRSDGSATRRAIPAFSRRSITAVTAPVVSPAARASSPAVMPPA
jgi:hypothetical protein